MDLHPELGKERITVSSYPSPAGEMLLGCLGSKLCICDWVASRCHETIAGRVCRLLHAVYAEGTCCVISKAIAQLDEYFGGQRKEFSIPIHFVGTPFQCAVWSQLRNIPYGITISYAEMARKVNNPKAVRAVASAIALNPLSVIVPCHRVIGSNHRLIGYGGGLDTKQMLLSLETAVSVGERFEPVG